MKKTESDRGIVTTMQDFLNLEGQVGPSTIHTQIEQGTGFLKSNAKGAMQITDCKNRIRLQFFGHTEEERINSRHKLRTIIDHCKAALELFGEEENPDEKDLPI